jgi:hypothetical protein
LFTDAGASLRARPPFTVFVSDKAALRAAAQGLAREFGLRDLRVAPFFIDGGYAVEHFPELVIPNRAAVRLKPDAISESCWVIHRHSTSASSHEIDLGSFCERVGTGGR